MSTESCKPVMVWIHGGAFAFGSGNDDIYGPDYLIEHNIVLVTMNYRLGPIGILIMNFTFHQLIVKKATFFLELFYRIHKYSG